MDLRVSNAASIEHYEAIGVKSTENTKKKVTVPIVNIQTELPLKGLEIEHNPKVPAIQDDEPDNDPKTKATTDEEPDDDPKTKATTDEDPDAEQEEGKTPKAINTDNVGGYDNPTSRTNSTFTGFKALQATLTGNESVTSDSMDSLDGVIKSMSDITNTSGQNFGFLSKKLDQGFAGGLFFSSSRSKNVSTQQYQGVFGSTWENRNETFAIDTRGAFGYTRTKTTINTADLMGAMGIDLPKQDDTSTATIDVSKQVNIDIAARFTGSKNFDWGVRAHSYFYDRLSNHTVSATVLHKPTGIGADLTRYETISKNLEGKTVFKGNTKFTVNILSNEPAEYEEFSLGKAAEVPDIESIVFNKPKDGSGFGLNIENDNGNFGADVEYGHNFIYNPERQVRFTVSPCAGFYDYGSRGAENESWRFMGGAEAAFKKRWAGGQALDLNLTACASRIVQKGSSPSDITHLIFKGRYVDPKKGLYGVVDAGSIKSGDIGYRYIEGNFGWNINDNISVAAQAGYSDSYIGSFGVKDYTLGAKAIFSIPYRRK